MGRLKGIKVEVQRFVLELGLEIFFLCHKFNHLRILFSVKNLLLASDSRDLASFKVFWKASFGHRFSHKIWTFQNFRRRPKCVGKHSFWDRIWTQILYFFEGNQESYRRYSFAQQVIKYGFRLRFDRWAWIQKTNALFLNLALKYFFYVASSLFSK